MKRNYVYLTGLLLSSFVLLFLPIVILAVTIDNPLVGVNSFPDLLCKIAGGVGVIIASLGVIAILIAAFLYLVSAGDTTKMSRAKTALIAGIIGIFIGVAAVPIVKITLEVLGNNSDVCDSGGDDDAE